MKEHLEEQEQDSRGAFRSSSESKNERSCSTGAAAGMGAEVVKGAGVEMGAGTGMGAVVVKGAGSGMGAVVIKGAGVGTGEGTVREQEREWEQE